MSTNDTYQGWTNRETWALMLHINNDEGLYYAAREVLSEGGEEGLREHVTVLLDPDEFREGTGESQPREIARMAHEVGSLWRVNWSEVYEALTE